MIYKAERTKLKRNLKNGWIEEVLKKLLENQIVNKNGKNYEKTYVSHVLNGRNSNDDIEKAIFEVAEQHKKLQTKMRVERNLKLKK